MGTTEPENKTAHDDGKSTTDPPSPSGGAPRPPSRRRRILLVAVLSSAFLLAAGSGSSLGYFLTFDIPQIRNLQDWQPPVLTTLYSADGEMLYQFGSEKRIVVPLDQIPQSFTNALIATEDSNFYHHVGIDPWGIARAIITDIIRLKKAQGGSTITQQLTRSLFLKPEKTIRRKLQELLLALQVEKTFTKNEILAFYCNQVYMGHGRYGVEAASRHYFGKSASEMTPAESALIAGLVQRPEAYSPLRSPERALARRNHVFSRMVDENMISEEAATELRAQPIEVADLPERDDIAPYFIEEVRRYLDARYGEEVLYQQGLEVYTTLDPKLQRAAEDAIRHGLHALDKRQGFRPITQNVLAGAGDGEAGTEDTDEKPGEDEPGGDPLHDYTHPGWSKRPVPGRLRYGVVMEATRDAATIRLGEYTATIGPKAIEWTKQRSLHAVLKVGDLAPFLVQAVDEESRTLTVLLDQEPLVEGALVAIDPSSGEIRALVGGYDFNRSQFDRAMQSYRQAGSAFKPFVYAAALASGYSLAHTFLDEPTIFVDQRTGDQYQPDNFARKYFGTTTLRKALEKSRNIVAVRLLNQVGYGRTIDIARRMGISSPLSPYPSLALGTMEVSLIDLTTAYSVFANQGVRVEPHLLRYVADREGKIREEAKPKVTEALRVDVAYLMTYLLEGVTESGTGAAATRALHRPVAGKTGTTDDLADAWFVGFSPSIVAGVWVGFDQKKSLGPVETGARAALPIWIDFMKAAHDGLAPAKFSRPARVIYVPIDRRTGLRATVESRCPTPFLEAFAEGTEPTEPCSEVEHFRVSLPYFLQRYEITSDLELQIDPATIVRLVNEGQGDLDVVPGGRELVLRQDGEQRYIPLDLSRSERRELHDLLLQSYEGASIEEDYFTEDGSLPPVGIDGRPATIVPITTD